MHLIIHMIFSRRINLICGLRVREEKKNRWLRLAALIHGRAGRSVQGPPLCHGGNESHLAQAFFGAPTDSERVWNHFQSTPGWRSTSVGETFSLEVWDVVIARRGHDALRAISGGLMEGFRVSIITYISMGLMGNLPVIFHVVSRKKWQAGKVTLRARQWLSTAVCKARLSYSFI